MSIVTSFSQITTQLRSETLLQLIPQDIHPLIDFYSPDSIIKEIAKIILHDYLAIGKSIHSEDNYMPQSLKDNINNLINDPTTPSIYLKKVCKALAATHVNINYSAKEQITEYEKITNLFKTKNTTKNPIFFKHNTKESSFLYIFENNFEDLITNGETIYKELKKLKLLKFDK